MIELIDIFFNQYLRIFFAIVFVGLIIFSLYCSYYGKLKKFLSFGGGIKLYIIGMIKRLNKNIVIILMEATIPNSFNLSLTEIGIVIHISSKARSSCEMGRSGCQVPRTFVTLLLSIRHFALLP